MSREKRARAATIAMILLVSLAISLHFSTDFDPRAEDQATAKVVVLPLGFDGPIELDHIAEHLTADLIESLARRRGVTMVAADSPRYLAGFSRIRRALDKTPEADFLLDGKVTVDRSEDRRQDDEIWVELQLIRTVDRRVSFRLSSRRTLKT